MTKRMVTVWPTLLAGLAVSLAVSLWVGPVRVGTLDILRILLGDTSEPMLAAVILKIRLPRAALTALVGASLASAGGAFQGLLRNPLADPYVLGVSGGAALGAVSILALGVKLAIAIPLAAFSGALGALAVVYYVARAHRASPHALILSGVMVGSFAAAALLFLLWLVPADSARAAIFWLAGDLSASDMSHLPLASLWGAGAFLILWTQAPALDLFTQGEETASDLGLDVGRSRLLLLAAGGALTASAVALAGLVGFVGLVVPHAVRLLWGPSHRSLIPASALLGASFLLVSDALARVVLAPSEVPVGVVTALVGAPFFLFLLRRSEA